MAAFDAQFGPFPPGHARFFDAMGQEIRFLVFVETECGLVRRLKLDDNGYPLPGPNGTGIEIVETRPAPIELRYEGLAPIRFG